MLRPLAHLDRDTFSLALANVPLVSVDIILRDADDRVLLGRRRNEPAKGYWFIPGGRIRKNETMEQAFHRIAYGELGLDLDFMAARLVGAFEHFYATNVFEDPGLDTHYLSTAYEVRAEDAAAIVLDEQHSEYRWFRYKDLMETPDVHEYTRNYFRPRSMQVMPADRR